MADLFSDITDGLAAVLPILERVAPTLATAVGGPLAGTAVTFLENALGLTPGAGAAAVSTALQTATPDQLATLKKLDNDFAVQMKEADISLVKIDADDRASARAREMTVKDYTPSVLAYFLVGGSFAAGGVVLMGYAKAESALAGAVLGYLFSEARSALAYFFGSTQGSQNKDEMLFASSPSTNAGAPVARPLS